MHHHLPKAIAYFITTVHNAKIQAVNCNNLPGNESGHRSRYPPIRSWY